MTDALTKSKAADADELLTLRLTRTIAAPREAVFRAWTDPAIIKQWWGPHFVKVNHVEVDPRPGGAFAIDLTNTQSGEDVRMAGVYLVLREPELVIMEIRHRQFEGAAQAPGGYIPTTVEVRLIETAEGTELSLVHAGFLDAAQMPMFEGGWTGSFDKLATALKSTTA